MISGCSGMPWVCSMPRYPLGLLSGPCGAFGSADARDHAPSVDELIAWVVAKA